MTTVCTARPWNYAPSSLVGFQPRVSPASFKDIPLALGQSYDCNSADKAILTGMGAPR